MTKISAIKADIVSLVVDAIVNAANTSLSGGSGVCGAIFDAAGYDDMTEACQEIGSCDYGEAVVTSGFRLPAAYVIHTVGPIYGQHSVTERDILTSCYTESLLAAEDRKIKSIAFPLISTGVYGYPKKEAIKIAIAAVQEYFDDVTDSAIKKVIFCAWTEEDLSLIESELL